MTTPFDLDGLRPDVAKVVELILHIVGGDFTVRGEVTGSGDDLDAVIVALNMMAESFSVERAGRERAEALLADAVDAYEHAPGLFCSCEPHGFAVVKCNETMAHAVGLSAEAVLGRSLLDLVDSSSRAGLQRALGTLLASGAMPTAEVTLLRAGAPGAVVSLAGSLKRGADGAPERLRLVMRDVTTERRLEEQLVHAQRMEAIGRLAGGVAHDFNNLLMVIQTAASLLQLRAKDRPNDLRDIALITEASERGAGLTRDLLAFSRRQPVRKELVRIDAVIEQSASIFSRLLGERSTLALQLESGDSTVELDPGKLVQALVNLIVNARDAMPAGGTVTVKTSRIDDQTARTELLRGPHVEVLVSDTGAGIDPEFLPRIFDPFFTTKPVGKGTGLGLSMVYGTVRQAGGLITASSVRGVGSTFRLVLPCASARAQRPAADASAAPLILLIEDDGPVRAVTSRILSAAGYRVEEAPSGTVALELAARPGARFDLVLSDVVMPDRSGLETVNDLRRRFPELPVVFMTGFSLERSGALEAVAHGVLEKPFGPAALLAIVSSALASSADAAPVSSSPLAQRGGLGG